MSPWGAPVSFRTVTQRDRTLRRVALAVTAAAVTAAAAVTFPMIASAQIADAPAAPTTVEQGTAPTETVPTEPTETGPSDAGHDDPKDDPKDLDPKDPKDPKDEDPKDDPKDDGDFEFPPFADAGIVPGVELLTEVTLGTASCTANFVQEIDGELFLGSAAHCHANSETLDGCLNDPLPLGTEVVVRGLDGVDYVTELAYSSWTTMQEVGETDAATCQLNDYALLRIDPDDYDRVNPSVPEFGGPEGLNTDGLAIGDLVFSYQNDMEDPPFPVMRAKQGINLGNADPEGLGYIVQTTTPGFPGDSGSGYLDADGQAFGVLSTEITLTTGEILNGVTDLAKAQVYAEDNADTGDITVVDGTEPFTPTGVLMDALPTSPLSVDGLLADGLDSLLGGLGLRG